MFDARFKRMDVQEWLSEFSYICSAPILSAHVPRR
jgi:hypothetical protein